MAIGKYDESRRILKDVKKPENQDKEMLLPITSSLYITGNSKNYLFLLNKIIWKILN